MSVILSGQSRDDVLDTIHNRLRDLGEEMRTAKIDLDEYEINRVRTLSEERALIDLSLAIVQRSE